MQRSAQVAVAALVLLVAGCTTSTAPPPAPTTAEPTASGVDWALERAEFFESLGPPPPSAPDYTEEEAHVALVQIADPVWAQILTRFPAATRPSAGFVEWQSEDDRYDESKGQIACLTEHGLAVDVGRDSEGNPGGIMLSLNDEASTVAAFFCQWVAFPIRPSPQFTPEQFGYQYDYLVGFVAPCLEAHGNDVPPPISREAYITEWPNQGWFPSITEIDDETRYNELLATCPSTMPDPDDPAF